MGTGLRLAARNTRMQASEIRELLKLLDRADIISFAGGIPDPALFPVDAFADAFAHNLSGSAARKALQYSPSEGDVGLRTWIRDHMASIGVECRLDNILLTSGSQQALDFLGKMFLSAGDTALVTWPTYLGALQAFNAYEPCYQRLDIQGNRSADDYARDAAAAGGTVKFAYMSPDFANPTGKTLSKAQRLQVIELAYGLDAAIIEDGAYQSLRYDGDDVATILGLEIESSGSIDNSRTIYCGTFSKTLSPGLRVGWVVARADVIHQLVVMKQAGDLHSATLNQMATAEVARNRFEQQVALNRETYRARRDAMLGALTREMPEGVTWTKPEGGMFIWVILPEGLDGAALLARSIETEKVAFVPGTAFFADHSGANSLRLSFSCANEATIAEGIGRLGRLLRAAIADGR